MTEKEIFELIAPQLLEDEEAVDDAIKVANIQIAEGFCGDKRPLLIAYLAAHLLVLAQRQGGASGSLSSLSEGQLSVGFTQSGADLGASLSQTLYGAEYDRLSRGCVFAARTRVEI